MMSVPARIVPSSKASWAGSAPAGSSPASDAALDVGEVSVAERAELLEPGLAACERGQHDLGDEALAGGGDRRELELLLRAEEDVDTALRHRGRRGEPGDRETLEALDRREPRGLLEDAGAGAVPRCTGPPSRLAAGRLVGHRALDLVNERSYSSAFVRSFV
jgi:hypothetical protein